MGPRHKIRADTQTEKCSVSQITKWHVLLVPYDLEDVMKEWNIMFGGGFKESILWVWEFRKGDMMPLWKLVCVGNLYK